MSILNQRVSSDLRLWPRETAWQAHPASQFDGPVPCEVKLPKTPGASDFHSVVSSHFMNICQRIDSRLRVGSSPEQMCATPAESPLIRLGCASQTTGG